MSPKLTHNPNVTHGLDRNALALAVDRKLSVSAGLTGLSAPPLAVGLDGSDPFPRLFAVGLSAVAMPSNAVSVLSTVGEAGLLETVTGAFPIDVLPSMPWPNANPVSEDEALNLSASNVITTSDRVSVLRPKTTNELPLGLENVVSEIVRAYLLQLSGRRGPSLKDLSMM